MRMAFGLVGILVTLGVIIMFMHSYELPAAKQAIKTRNAVNQQFGSNSPEGMADAQASIVLDDVERGGHFNALLVKSITAGGPPARSSSRLNSRPMSGLTPSTRKKPAPTRCC